MHHSPFKTHTSRRGTCWDAAKMWANQRKIGVFGPKIRSKTVSLCLHIAIHLSVSLLFLRGVFCSVFPLLLVVFRVCKPQDPKFNMASSLNEFLLKFLEVGGSRYIITSFLFHGGKQGKQEGIESLPHDEMK